MNVQNGSNDKFRVRVERLLKRHIQTSDLYELFSFARDRSKGRRCVKEIGHFVAHTETRDQGITVEAARAWYYTASFHMAKFGRGDLPPLADDNLPSATKDYFKIAFDIISPKVIRLNTGLALNDAKAIMKRIIEGLTENADGTWAMPWNYTKEQNRVFLCAVNFLSPRPAFEADELIKEFLDVLKENQLITRDEINVNNDYIRKCVVLFAISKMHNCNIEIGTNKFVTLKASVDCAASEINIRIAVPSTAPMRPDIKIATSMFRAHLNLQECIDQQLNVHNSEWACEVELGQDCRIAPILP